MDNKIYLDYNLIVACVKQNKDVKKVIDACINNRKELKFIYSPAHLEEVARIKMANEKDSLAERAKYMLEIDRLTNGYEVRPISNEEGLCIIKENSVYCYLRVIKDNGESKSRAVENSDYQIIKKRREEPLFDPSMLGMIDPEEIFHRQDILEFAEKDLEDYKEALINVYPYIDFSIKEKYATLKEKSFHVLEAMIESLAKTLNIIRYKGDKEESIKHGATHDISHMHYARMADVFVTEDRRLREKTKAIYSFLEIPTKVFSFKEFASWIDDNIQIQ